jgi:hypothetical protein
MRIPLHKTAYRSPVNPVAFTSIRSTDESTKRAVPELDISSPKTFHGSMAVRKLSSTSLNFTRPICGKRNSKNGSSQLMSNA